MRLGIPVPGDRDSENILMWHPRIFEPFYGPIINMIFKYFRLKEPVHLVKGATRRTLCAVAVAEFPFTSKRKSALPVDIPELRSVGMDGLSKLQDVILLALAV